MVYYHVGVSNDRLYGTKGTLVDKNKVLVYKERRAVEPTNGEAEPIPEHRDNAARNSFII